MTLIEITLVIAILLTLISVLFIGISTYKKGADRAQCITNIEVMQKVVRSYANLNQLEIDEALVIGTLVGAGRMLPREPKCPDTGSYTFQTKVPSQGPGTLATELYLSCSLATAVEKHVPRIYAGW